MKIESKISMKIVALQLAANARRKNDDLSFVYEQGQAIYQWLMEEVEQDEKIPDFGVNVTGLVN